MATVLAIRARGITKCFGEVVALDGVDLDVASGQIHGLVGPNCAGKTTLLGLAVADQGRLEIVGAPIRRTLDAPDGVANFVDGPGLYPSLTARQNLAALVALRGRDAPSAGIDEVLDEIGLTDVADDRANGFSLGMRQRLGLAAALPTKPRLLVLDEPSHGRAFEPRRTPPAPGASIRAAPTMPHHEPPPFDMKPALRPDVWVGVRRLAADGDGLAAAAASGRPRCRRVHVVGWAACDEARVDGVQ